LPAGLTLIPNPLNQHINISLNQALLQPQRLLTKPMTQRFPKPRMISVITKNDMRRRIRSPKLNFRPLCLAMAVPINIPPRLAGCETKRLVVEADDRAVAVVELLHALVKSAFALLYVPEDGEGDPQAWTGVCVQRVEVEVVECYGELVEDEDCWEGEEEE